MWLCLGPKLATRFTLLGAFVFCGPSAAAPALVDCVWTQDFEDGTTGGWSSYPPFQDTAYDYSLLGGYDRSPNDLQGYIASGEMFYPVELAPPTSEGNRYYCLRAYRPNSTAPQKMGLCRKVHLHAAEDSVLRFDFWLKLTASPADLLVEIAGGDGIRYQHRLEQIDRERWVHVDLPLSSFSGEGGSVPPGLEIQALAIVPELKKGDPAVVHYFALDNVRLSCRRQAVFSVTRPIARLYDKWDLGFIQRHFHPGDGLEVEVHPEIPVVKVTARLDDLCGKTVFPAETLSVQGERWVGETLLAFPDREDCLGPLLLVLQGETPQGQTVESRLRLWCVKPLPDDRHPRLFFSNSDLEGLRNRTKEGRGKTIWESVVAQARSARSRPVPETGQVEEFPSDYLIMQLAPYFDAVRQSARGAMLNAFVYCVEGDEEAGEYAKGTLLRMAGWNQWVHPWFRTQGRKTYYPVGLAAMDLGIAYDLVFPLLTEEERAKVREGVLKNGIVNSYEEYFVDNRIPNHTSNWISHTTAGPLVALLAFYGEGEIGDGEPYFSGLAEKFIALCQATYRPDGSYGEGYGYQNFTLESACPFLAAMDSLLGAGNLAHSLNLTGSYLFPLSISTGGGTHLLEMGDSSDSLGAGSNWAWLASVCDDPLFNWFYSLRPGSEWQDFLWQAELKEAVGPGQSLPPCRYFPDKGNVVFRTGWGEEDAVFVYHAGPHYNHTHMDQGNFRMWAFGEDLVDESGKAGYYTDPYYWSYFIQSGGHNTILVDGFSESQDVGDFKNEVVAHGRRAFIEKVFLSEPFNYVNSELGRVYREPLERLNRQVCFVSPGYAVIRDTIRAASGSHTYQWQLFPPHKEGVSLTSSGATYEGEEAFLHVHVVEPSGARVLLKDRPIPMGEYANYPKERLHPRAVLQVTQDRAAESQEFLVVLVPGKKGDAGSVSRAEPLVREGSRGVRVVGDGWLDEILFGQTAEVKAVETSREPLWFYRRQGESTVAASGIGIETLEIDNEAVLSSKGTVDAAVHTSPDGETWWLNADRPTTVSIDKRGAEAGRMVLEEGKAALRSEEPDRYDLTVEGRVRLRIAH